MTSSFDPLPEWAHAVPSEPGIHPEQSALQWQRPFTVQQLLEIGEQFIEQFLAWVVRAVAGVFIPGEASFDQLRDWALNIPILGDIIEAITGLVGGGIEELTQFFTNVRNFFQSIDFNSPSFNVLDAARQFVAVVVRPFLSLLFSWVRPEWLPQVSLFSIGDDQPNLLTEGDFAEEVTIDGGGFYWDSTDGKTTMGCAAVNCDGEDHVVISNLIPVSPGQKLSAGGYVSHAGASGSNAIQIALVTYLDGTTVSTEVLGSISPSTDSTDWSKSISGTYTVPSGVNQVALQLRVSSAATAGVVKFDDCWVKKEQLLKIPFVDGLTSALDTFTEKIRDIIDAVFNAFNNLGEWLEENNPVSAVVDAVLGLLGIGNTNSTGLAQLQARVRALESSANTIVLDFNGPSSSNPGPGFSVTSSGGGSGSMGLDGKGSLVWKPSGAGNRTQIARYTTSALTTNNCLLQWYLASTPQSYVFDDAYTYICCRMDGVNNYLRVRSGYDSVRIQAVVGGSVSNVGSAWSGYPKAGDFFEWQVGDAGGGNNRHHVLRRNGQTILDFTETTSVYGSSNLHVGVGMETGNRLVLFQNIPAALTVLTASEVL
ncbi:minor tail protein [Mycobacterium phage WIVsmall]|uniref:minor tail protein n=1 Tax=Mycobacterium phage WIVsmall TaxID=1327036 RepID=UPI00032B6351|nr:minor tail protein [Mycobacterium phage WIVsmall]AGK88218.1 putative structural protein [Mycobacterium phage WIVsmall]